MKETAIDSPESAALERVRAAVIDIGSNSVRLVVYDGPRRAPFPIANEKALCGLGRDMTDNGALNEKSMESALDVLARYRCLLAEHGDPKTHAVATAAVREAKNGAEFVARINALGLKIDVVGGGEEASLAAFGVTSFEPWASGLVGDMGGGSLELVALDKGAAGEATSLSIGPLRLMQQSKGDMKSAAKIVEKALVDVDWLKKRKGDTLFAVGGAWRSIARVNMQLHKHPLPVLHHYEMAAKQAIETCDLISRQSKSSLEQTPGISSKRLDTLPYAALVMRMLVETISLKTVSISAGGLREGLLYRAMPEDVRAYDPLLAGAAFLAARMEPVADVGAAYDALTAGVFANESPAERRIRVAVCLLADIGAYFHPDMRADHAFETALRAPFYGVTHAERAAIALALYSRHEGVKNPSSPVLSLMSEAELKRAKEIGVALRFCAAFAPKAPHALGLCSLTRDDKTLSFRAPKSLEALFDETVRKRFEALANIIGLAGVADFTG